MKKIAIITFLICFMLFEGLSVPTAHANAGPPRRVEDGDAAFLIPMKHESIEVVSEDLVYDIKVTDEADVFAEIQAVYEMRNTATESASTLVAFVANNPQTPVKITLDGNPVELLNSLTMPWNVTGEAYYVGDLLKREWSNVGSWTEYGVWEPTFEEILRFAATGERTGDTDTGYDLELSMFELTLEAGATHTLGVSYTENAAVITERQGYAGYGNPHAEFYYFLEPAQYWKDFSDLAVTIRLPNRMSLEASLDGFVREGDAYVARFHHLPGKNLRILVNLTTPSVFGAVAKAGPWILVFLAAALIVGSARRRSRGPEKEA